MSAHPILCNEQLLLHIHIGAAKAQVRKIDSNSILIELFRCFIPECDIEYNITYANPWNPNAIPSKFDLAGNLLLDSCTRFKYNSTTTGFNNNDTCSANWFTNETEKCDNWVFDENERTIVQDVSEFWRENSRTFFENLFNISQCHNLFHSQWNITCPEQQWLLALVGTVHFIGYLCGSFWILLGDKWVLNFY